MEKPQHGIVNFSDYTWRRKNDNNEGFYTTREKEDAFSSFMGSMDAIRRIGPINEYGYSMGLFSIAWVFNGLFFMASRWSKSDQREDVKKESYRIEEEYKKAIRIVKEYGDGQEIETLFRSLMEWLSLIKY